MRACNCARASPFQSRTCEGCDRCYPICCRLRYQVSIHAPAWGATFDASSFVVGLTVSIHAPAWGATTATEVERDSREFQSTHPRGVRPAPSSPRCHGTKSFNPRTRVGCDVAHPSSTDLCGRFQSTHPRGVRLASIATHRHWSRSFNPRTRVGCDPQGAPCNRPACACFNPRTRVGCDSNERIQGDDGGSFNPRTRVGCDPRLTWKALQRQLFQSTHPRGVRRPLLCPTKSGLPVFQSTHPRGVRPKQDSANNAHLLGVSIHAPAWGATSCLMYRSF